MSKVEDLPKDVENLVTALIEQTTDGSVRWRRTDERDTSFAYRGEAAGVAIESSGHDGRHPYILSLLTPDGVRTQSWQSWQRGALSKQADLIEGLYNAARKSATGVADADDLVRGLMSELASGAGKR